MSLGVYSPHNEVGDAKEGKQVGMFYFLWQGDDASKTSEIHWDLSKMLPKHAEILEDRTTPIGAPPAWGTTTFGANLFTATTAVMTTGCT